MINKTIKLFSMLFLAIALIGLISAQLTIDSVNQDQLFPGEEATITVEVNNNYNYDIDNVQMTLLFNGQTTGVIDFSKTTIFSAVGSSQDSQDSIGNDDSEKFVFTIKASNSVSPGDYNIPYSISYEGKNGSTTTEYGTIGVSISSKTNLDFAISQQTKVIDTKDKVGLKIINKGFGEIKFVTVQADSTGSTILSDKKVYIGSVASDDFEIASFDILLTKTNPSFSATITYKDFENNDKTQVVNYDLTAYTREKALSLGLIQKSNTPFIFGLLVAILIIYLVIRAIRKRKAIQRKQNSRDL